MRHEPKKLTDRFLKSLKPARSGQRDEYPDTVVQGFIARMTDTGGLSFALTARYPAGGPDPTRRKLGDFAPLSDGELRAAKTAYDKLPADEREELSLDQYLLRIYGPTTLAAAREKARRWKTSIAAGRDPAQLEEQQRLTEQKKRENSFTAVCEDFIAEKLPGERAGKDCERDIRRVLIPRWGALPIADITDLQIIALIKAKKRTAPVQARNLLALAKRLFTWAVDQRVYGLKVSPCAGLKPKSLIGRKTKGRRILTDEELFALWRAAKRMPYPHGRVYQLLMMTALRLNEVADATWSEFNLSEKLWVIPAERMKGKDETAQPHAVPLTDDMLLLLSGLPRFKTGKHVFSTTFGDKPAWMGDKIKKRLDARMLRILQAMARKRGDDPAEVELKPFKNHDIRRTVRSNLSKLRIPEEAREAVMAHVRPGIKGVYDVHDYLDEKIEALTQWSARLRLIVDPTPTNVVPLVKARA